jgi:L-fuconolactonase
MRVVDSHQHFWNYNPVRDGWITEEMQVIRRDFLPADLLPELRANGIEACVTVQADQSEKQNTFLLEQAANHDFIQGVVGWIDFESANVYDRLSYYSRYKKMKGFRHVLQGEPQRDFMLRKDFKRGIGLLAQFNFRYDLLVFTDQLKYTKEFVAAFPNQPFILDHIAKPNIKENKIGLWEKDIKELAKHENVFCKISGLITEADWKNWKPADITPYLDVVVEAFGIKRIMYGSDWPVCLVAGSYEKVFGLVKEYFSSFTEHEQELFFHANATKFYRL